MVIVVHSRGTPAMFNRWKWIYGAQTSSRHTIQMLLQTATILSLILAPSRCLWSDAIAIGDGLH